MPRLTRVAYHFLTRGDGIDHDSMIKLEIFDQNGHQLIASHNFTGGGSEMTHNCTINRTTQRSELNGKISYIEIIPNGHDKWESDCDIRFEFDDGTVTTFNHGRIKLGNHDGWGHFVQRALSGI